MITLTIVRHGESTDNLKACWAGWADAPLSVHGMNQAKALGASLKDVNIDAIFASSLLRALWTAQQIESQQEASKPPLTVSPLLREQHFGVAEQKPFGDVKGGYTRQSGRSFSFEGGENLHDVRARADEAIDKFIMPSICESKGAAASKKHLVVVAHGIFNAELIGALLARTEDSRSLEWGYKGMTNTGWTRLEIGLNDETAEPSSTVVTSDPQGPMPPSSVPPSAPSPNPPPATATLKVRILCTDVTRHLDGVHRQKGGIGRQSYDEKQKDLRAFFSGAK